jgi:hypothetical protein
MASKPDTAAGRLGSRTRLFASPSMKRCSTLRRNRIIPATTTTHGSLDQIPTTDFPRVIGRTAVHHGRPRGGDPGLPVARGP